MTSVVNQDRVQNGLGSVSEAAKDSTREKMLSDDNAEKKWRERNVEEDDGLTRIVECLRGRLVAERTASRVAKEEAELMGNKLIELERQLKAEIESKNRAEKKLKFLTKKLESLKLAPISDQLSSSETSSGLKYAEEEKTESDIAGSIKCDREEEISETKESSTSADPSRDDASNLGQMYSSEGSPCSVIIGYSYNNRDFPAKEPSKVDENVSSKEGFELAATDDLGLRYKFRNRPEFSFQSIPLSGA